MSIEDLRSYRNAKPFRPFDIIMDDDTAVFVELPSRMALSPSGRMACVYVKNDLEFVVMTRVKSLPARPPMESSPIAVA